LISQLDEEDKNAVYRIIDCILTQTSYRLSLNNIFELLNSILHVTVYAIDKEYSHFVELAKKLHYIKKIKTDG